MSQGNIWAFDIGSRSIGWAVLGADADGLPTGEVIDANVVLHSGGVLDDTDGTTRKAVHGRIARSRRRLKRKKTRRADLRTELADSGFALQDGWRHRNPWWARATLAAGPVEDRDRASHLVATALPHMSKHRGWRNPWRSAPLPGEGETLDDVAEAAIELGAKSGEAVPTTLGAVCWHLMNASAPTKLRQSSIDGSENQLNVNRWVQKVLQKHIAAELTFIWEVQAEAHPDLFTSDALRNLCATILHQEKPGVPLERIGRCSFDSDRYRAPKASPLFQSNRLLAVIANLRLLDEVGAKRSLESSEREIVWRLLNSGERCEWSEISAALGVDERQLVHADKEKTAGRPPTNQLTERLSSTKLKGIDKLRGWWDAASERHREALVAVALADRTIDADDPEVAEEVAGEIEDLGLLEVVEAFGRALPPGRAKYSRLVLGDLNGVMDDRGVDLHSAIELTYGHGSAEAQVAWDDPVPSAGVEASMKEVRQVVEALEGEYGAPATIGVEIVREATLSHVERSERNARIQRERGSRDAARDCLREDYGIEHPGDQEITKREHMTAQANACLYCGGNLQLGSTDLDHIVPRSTGGATIFNNIVAACRPCNQSKGKRTFAAWCEADGPAGEARMEETLGRLSALTGPRWKDTPAKPYFDADHRRWVRSEKDQAIEQIRRRLKKVNQDREFDEADLHSTAFVSRAIVGRLKQRFPDAKVAVLRGGMTAALRNETKLPAILGDGDRKKRSDRRHHAIDALAVGLLTNDTWAARVRRRNEAYRNHKIGTLPKRKLAEVYEGANIDSLIAAMDTVRDTGKPIFEAIVPVCPRRLSTTGRIHEDTVRPWVSKAFGEAWNAKEISSARNSAVREFLWKLSTNGGSVKADPGRSMTLEDGTVLTGAAPIACARRLADGGKSAPTATWLPIRGGWAKTGEIHHARLVKITWSEGKATKSVLLMVPLPLIDVYEQTRPMKIPMVADMVGVRSHPKLARILSVDPKAVIEIETELTQGDVLLADGRAWEVTTFDVGSNRAEGRPALLGGKKSEGESRNFVASGFGTGSMRKLGRDGLGHPVAGDP